MADPDQPRVQEFRVKLSTLAEEELVLDLFNHLLRILPEGGEKDNLSKEVSEAATRRERSLWFFTEYLGTAEEFNEAVIPGTGRVVLILNKFGASYYCHRVLMTAPSEEYEIRELLEKSLKESGIPEGLAKSAHVRRYCESSPDREYIEIYAAGLKFSEGGLEQLAPIIYKVAKEAIERYESVGVPVRLTPEFRRIVLGESVQNPDPNFGQRRRRW